VNWNPSMKKKRLHGGKEGGLRIPNGKNKKNQENCPRGGRVFVLGERLVRKKGRGFASRGDGRRSRGGEIPSCRKDKEGFSTSFRGKRRNAGVPTF